MLGLSAQLFPSGPTVNLQSALAGNPAKSYLLQCVHHGLKVHAFGQLFLPSATAKKDKWSEDLLLPGSPQFPPSSSTQGREMPQKTWSVFKELPT